MLLESFMMFSPFDVLHVTLCSILSTKKCTKKNGPPWGPRGVWA